MLTTLLFVQALGGRGEESAGFIVGVSALAVVHGAVRQLRRGDGRGARQGAGGCAAAQRARRPWPRSLQPARAQARYRSGRRRRTAAERRGPGRGGRLHPGDGEVIEGVASVDESAVTGESAPVIRETGGDRSAVTGGTRVLSDWLVVRITANPGEGFLDRMISPGRRGEAAEDPQRDRAEHSAGRVYDHLPARRAPRCCRSRSTASGRRAGHTVTVTVLVALLVCLIPDDDRRPARARSASRAWTA